MQHGDRIECWPHAPCVFVVTIRECLPEDVLNGRQVLGDLVFPLFPSRIHRCRKQSPQKPFQEVLPLNFRGSEEPPGCEVRGPEVFGISLKERLAFLA